MSDIKPKSPSIPQWQQPAAASTNTDNSTSTPSPNSDEAPRSELIEQARKFLQDDSIRDAPVDRKIAFLESKGLRSEEIDSLLGISRDADESSTSTNSNTAEGNKATPESTTSSTSNESQSPKESPSSSSTSSASSSTAPATPTATKSSAPRDVPPIITYPEFLMQQSKPPPLVTLRSILYTLYGAAGLGASLYGASEYLVKPMLATLTSARLELAQTANTNLQKLNEKLEQNVSRIPPHLSAKDTQRTEPIDSEDDEDSITSDPTELFHRDVATQTSQDLDATPLPRTLDHPSSDEATPDPTATVNTHLKRLENITSHLREVASSEKESGALDDSVRTRLNELHHYLDTLLYSRSSYNPVTAYGVYSTPGLENAAGPSVGISKGEEDAIASFRADIRGVKGALLSARNFPASRGRTGSGIVSGR
ncbi:hypothetical protein CNMCM5793_004370 [Aspergillus hiratsukae]|uniref:Peroxisomal membrane protein PEX14 n=1 Tax=Aspergillus hiratsukae TaxID=1194566 RepID=A0A8H6QBB1_9EURO|nr:hypothetical protein CNMCM5793_004370 [Aspergillus hiratsukae]KAF7169946.1 hypothetical protein CNMCM6106_004804 [Aspergillus hiratsukae]